MIGFRSLLSALVAALAALALAIPTAAVASTGDGGGGAPYTITTARFTGYQCTFYGYLNTSELYNCRGGVRVTVPGEQGFYPGTRCLRRSQGWMWFWDPCGQI